MKPSKLIKVLAIIIVVAILIGLSFWTLSSPAAMQVQSPTQLRNGLFGAATLKVGDNITDGTGTYYFLFGLDYDQNITSGGPTRIAVYCALASEKINSAFTKGVALILESSSILIDGRSIDNVNVSSVVQASLETYYYVFQGLSLSQGSHNLEIKITVTTVDVNYVGNALGTYQTVNLNGTFNFL